MNNIQPINFNGKIKNQTLRRKNKAINVSNTLTNDIFQKNKKETIIKAAVVGAIGIGLVAGAIINSKKGKNNNFTFDEFRKLGGEFKKGIALRGGKKPFSGTLTKTTQKGDVYVVEYKNGLMQKSTKNFKELVDEFSQKEYLYDKNGKLKEVINQTFKTDDGVKAIYSKQPEYIRRQLGIDHLYDKKVTSKVVYDDNKVSTFVADFAKTIEGKRRAKMSDDEIEQEIRTIFDKILADKGIDKKYAPTLIIEARDTSRYGYYDEKTNTLGININSYKIGGFSLEETLMHEGTHFEEALLRNRLDKNVIQNLIIEKLISRIYEGEGEKIIVKGGLFGFETIEPPKLSEKMKKEFEEFSRNNLYTKAEGVRYALGDLIGDKTKLENETQRELLAKITKLIDDNPDFIQQFSSRDEAIEMLTKYSMSHNTRFNIMTNITNIDTSAMPKLTLEEQKRAIESLNGKLETMEGNAKVSGIKIFGATQEEYNSYQFSREEVLAEQKGYAFLIREFKSKMEQMRKKGTLTPALEAYYNDEIKKAQQIIEYKTKGEAWYKKYLESVNNPNNATLKEAIEKEWEEIEEIIKKTQRELIPTGVWQVTRKK